jgi:hypothetical protein
MQSGLAYDLCQQVKYHFYKQLKGREARKAMQRDLAMLMFSLVKEKYYLNIFSKPRLRLTSKQVQGRYKQVDNQPGENMLSLLITKENCRYPEAVNIFKKQSFELSALEYVLQTNLLRQV